eukprot:TRINITY_DN47455_c0_g1_i2.p1 TRINITY_DN47455_c0_g1~~TRINITY_DN47455_c0_g1_i2.p1  ORF type:complete len:577 (+),score=71.32 TRINITY_DN47455_c0_g1_i2:202-1731(+)
MADGGACAGDAPREQPSSKSAAAAIGEAAAVARCARNSLRRLIAELSTAAAISSNVAHADAIDAEWVEFKREGVRKRLRCLDDKVVDLAAFAPELEPSRLLALRAGDSGPTKRRAIDRAVERKAQVSFLPRLRLRLPRHAPTGPTTQRCVVAVALSDPAEMHPGQLATVCGDGHVELWQQDSFGWHHVESCCLFGDAGRSQTALSSALAAFSKDGARLWVASTGSLAGHFPVQHSVHVALLRCRIAQDRGQTVARSCLQHHSDKQLLQAADVPELAGLALLRFGVVETAAFGSNGCHPTSVAVPRTTPVPRLAQLHLCSFQTTGLPSAQPSEALHCTGRPLDCHAAHAESAMLRGIWPIPEVKSADQSMLALWLQPADGQAPGELQLRSRDGDLLGAVLLEQGLTSLAVPPQSHLPDAASLQQSALSRLAAPGEQALLSVVSLSAAVPQQTELRVSVLLAAPAAQQGGAQRQLPLQARLLGIAASRLDCPLASYYKASAISEQFLVRWR